MELDCMNNLTTQTPHAGELSWSDIYIQFPVTFTKLFTLSEGIFWVILHCCSQICCCSQMGTCLFFYILKTKLVFHNQRILCRRI
jgi:hypothetical protein